jgi:hypothetical protein
MDPVLWLLLPVLGCGWLVAFVRGYNRRVSDRRFNLLLDQKLEDIRSRVDGNLDTAMMSELNALRGQVVLMKRVLARSADGDDDAADVAVLAQTEDRVAELARRIRAKTGDDVEG